MKRRKAALVCCSNALKPEKAEMTEHLCEMLHTIEIETVLSNHMYADTTFGHGTGKERAAELMGFYRDTSVTEIYDLSGGDLANQILPYLDYEIIRKAGKPFYGYSDLTVVLNAIYEKTGREGVLYQVRHLLSEPEGTLIRRFQSEEVYQFSAAFLRGKSMAGTLVGGNIRCFLKLAGTEYFPDLKGKILFLEAYSGDMPRMLSYLCQLEQLGAFQKVSGVLLGTFTSMERSGCVPSMEELVLNFVPEGVSVAKTWEIGHAPDSRAIRIGGFYSLSEKQVEKR